MEPIIALTILFCVYAAGELIAQKTKAVFSTVLGIAILLLAGFWSGILPRSVIEDAQVTGFGNVIRESSLSPWVPPSTSPSCGGSGKWLSPPWSASSAPPWPSS